MCGVRKIVRCTLDCNSNNDNNNGMGMGKIHYKNSQGDYAIITTQGQIPRVEFRKRQIRLHHIAGTEKNSKATPSTMY